MKNTNFKILMIILLIILSAATYFLLNFIDQKITEKIVVKMDDYLQKYQLKERMDYKKLDYTLFTGAVEISDITLFDDQRNLLCRIESIEIHSYKTSEKMIQRINLTVTHMNLINDQLNQVLQQYKLPSSQISLKLDADLKKQGNQFYYNMIISLFESAEFQLQFLLGNFNFNDYKTYLSKITGAGKITDPAVIQPAAENLLNLNIKKILIRLTDQGILNSWFEHEHNRQNKNREEIISDLEALINQMTQNKKSVFMKDTVEKIKRFLRGSGSLTLEIRPKQDFLIKDFQQWDKPDRINIDEAVNLLNITFNYEKR